MTGSPPAVCHWAEAIDGGGERVGWELARAFDAPLIVGERNPDIEPEDVDVEYLFDGHGSDRLIQRGGLFRMLGFQAGWSSAHSLRDYDALVTSGNECLAYVPGDEQAWLHYVHHTSRYATDRLPEIEAKHTGRTGPVIRRVEYLQRWLERQVYRGYAQKPTLLVANSEVIARRIQTYWGIPRSRIRVCYPPVPTDTFSPSDADTGDYYLTLSRLDWHKNIDEIVRAFNDTDHRLVVAGDGQERDALEALAGANVDVLGYVSSERKRELMAGAKGFVFAGQAEDFGLVTAEAMAAGTPVLGVAEGFTKHQVLNGLNGYTWTRGELHECVREFERHGVEWSEEEIAAFAARNFGRDRFRDRMQQLLKEAKERQRISVDLAKPRVAARP